MKINKINNNECEVTFITRPRGATNMVGDDGKMVAGISSTHTFDFSEINPDKVEIPNGIMQLALRSVKIDAQQDFRESCEPKDLDGLKQVLESNARVTVSATKTKTKKESDKEKLIRLKTQYPKMTMDEQVSIVMDTITEADLYNKYNK